MRLLELQPEESSMVLLVILALPLATSSAPAQTTYMEPDSGLVKIVDAQLAPWISISPDCRYWALRTPLRHPSIAELAREELKLAGLRFSPATYAPTRRTRYIGIELMEYPGLEVHSVSGLPDNLRSLSFRWSADGAKLAMTNETSEGVELWVLDAEKAESRRILGPHVSLAAYEMPLWLPDGSGLVCCTVPEERSGPPGEDPVPAGPVIRETFGEEAPVRTLQDLLEDPHDKDLFEYYLTSQLSIVRLDGTVERIGRPGMIWAYLPSPNGEYLLVERLHRPFSYSVNAWRFPTTIEVWDMEGNVVLELADLPLREEIPIARGSTYKGPRSVDWRSNTDATLCWVEALDEGDAGSEAELRDRVFSLQAPFDSEPRQLMDLEYRFGGIDWGNDSLALVSEWWWVNRRYRTWRIRPGRDRCRPELVLDYVWEDRYNHPGNPLRKRNDRGHLVLVVSADGGSIYLQGRGASPEGNRPFLDRLDLATLQKERLFRSRPPFYEQPIRLVDDSYTELLLRRESPEQYPNYYVRNLENDTESQVTFFENPFTQLQGMHKELLTYARGDGIELSAMLYLPPGYDPGEGPLPLIMWAYPQEYRSSAAASQVSGSPYEFDYLDWWSPLIWLTRGYAVLENPAMPIVGEGDRKPNDDFVPQLVMSARAAVDKVVDMGVADPDRIVISGHSYGAFMTANLLAHSDLFCAGIARTGAYNRTLTPFGFQSEDRSLWEATDVYVEMSPFMNADSIEEPILLIHGEEDRNSGTFPMQSERMYEALKGLGGTARLVMLPLEGHWYEARESVLHVVWETQQWLDEYASQGRF
ncbi:prolyl oligopeptidase family serine peptidase [Candidatus Fermentibacteria bacterium]|nr:prolyl oligopeptidase family serine peptidase [Candidatus Fermentibacteria bacterium]